MCPALVQSVRNKKVTSQGPNMAAWGPRVQMKEGLFPEKGEARACCYGTLYQQGFPGGTSGKNPPANAGDTGGWGPIPGPGRSPEEEMAIHSSILAWRTPRTEEPGGLQSLGLQRAGHD